MLQQWGGEEQGGQVRGQGGQVIVWLATLKNDAFAGVLGKVAKMAKLGGGRRQSRREKSFE